MKPMAGRESRLLAQILAGAGIALMLVGFSMVLFAGSWPALPGPSAGFVPPEGAGPGWAWLVMSAGILLLGILPAMQVLLALAHFLRRRDIRGAVVALVVLAELALSTLLE